jgi:pyruvate/2-oxoglutarate dehydrogenase complex dihydrolipoamide dehydrogenase (E3) component
VARPATSRTHDVIVVGAGPAGEVVAGKLGERGLDVALVERELIGGECSFWACMPSKALLRPGELAAETRRVPGVSDASVEPIAALRRRDKVIHELDDSGQLPWLEQRAITLVRGSARLAGERRVLVRPAAGDAGPGGDLQAGAQDAELELTARRAVVLATGTTAAIPPVDGLREARPWTNREATTVQHVPPRLLVLGGGVVGVELAQAWASYGTAVTLVEQSARVLANEEPAASEAVTAGLRRHGVDVRCDTEVTAARRGDDGVVTLTLGDDDGGSQELQAEELLVATGRRPRTDDLGLDTVGLEAGRPIAVDGRLRVPGHDWLYAIGDVNGRALLTHEGKYQARIVADAIEGRDGLPRDDGPPPRVVFTDPAVAAVGHTLDSARRAGLPVTAVDGRIDSTAGASFHGKGEDAFARWIVDEHRRVLVGATFVGPDVAEFVHAATIALVGEVTVDRLLHAVPSFPTRGEVWLQLADWSEGSRGRA